MVELSDEVKEFIVKTVREEISRILPLTVVTKEDLRLAIEAMNKRFEDLQKYMDRRFEDMNRRFDGLVRLLQIMFIVLSLLIAVFGFLRAAM